MSILDNIISGNPFLNRTQAMFNPVQPPQVQAPVPPQPDPDTVKKEQQGGGGGMGGMGGGGGGGADGIMKMLMQLFSGGMG